MRDLSYHHAFNLIRNLGPARFARLKRQFPSLDIAWRASASELVNAGLEQPIVDGIISKRREIDPAKEMEKLTASGIAVVVAEDDAYPPLLRHLHNAPAVLYVRGSIAALSHPFPIAIVGTRKISAYGKQTAPLMARDLSSAGMSVVSGLALGVDASAHEAALAAGGPTIAVLGCGVDTQSIYPPQNKELAERIAAGAGALISEFPPGTEPLKLHFPFRNRIIAGMAMATLVIEADEKSGALITAAAALEYGREVFAVPGSIFSPVSRGPNALIRKGATPVVRASEILEELHLQQASTHIQAREIHADTPQEAEILKLLSSEPVHINEIIRSLRGEAPAVSSALVMMELKGKIRNIGSMQYVKNT